MAGANCETTTDSQEAPSIWSWPSTLARWLLGTGLDSARTATSTGPVARFRNIAISREAGAGGGTIGRLVGTRLSWKVYDHELLEAIAQGMKVSTEEARTYDELAPGLVQDWLLPLREEHYAPQEAYLDHLAKLVDSIGKAGEAIIVGRGAGQILPRSETLTVRIIAPLKIRSKNLALKMGVSQRTARKAAIERDYRADKFIKTLHRVDNADPHLYDLVLDSHSLGLTIATELIVKAVEMGRPATVGPSVPDGH
jgi:cytidylate kinase